MGTGRTRAVALVGLTGQPVEVEAHLFNGLPQFQLVGTVDSSIREARSRVVAAASCVGVDLNQRKVTVNLTPAALPKRGPTFDVAIAVCVLVARGVLAEGVAERVVHVGELGLDARLRPVPGILPIVTAAQRGGFDTVVVPTANAEEARLVDGVRIVAAADLGDVIRFHGGQCSLPPADPVPLVSTDPAGAGHGPVAYLDLVDVIGQAWARRALEVAAAGGHHLLMTGPPGAGKSMLAARLPGLLPPLEGDVAVEVSAVHSVAGVLDAREGLVRHPPFEAPHHSASVASIVGGGPGIPLPGAMSRAHRGVLFLDEAPEFNRGVLEALRQPLEDGKVCVARAFGSVIYPAKFQLVLAANPCPCGQFIGKGHLCSCRPMERRTYLAKLSGPILDRVDVRVDVPAARLSAAEPAPESSATVRARVHSARAAQRERYRDGPHLLNADLSGPDLRGQWRPAAGATTALDRMLDTGRISLRGYDRVLRVAWTLADLARRDRPDRHDVDEATQLREPQLAVLA
ncbi:MAG: YifB family Mg chelatase-like AAA ATPase [Actinomycetales bacterium]